MLRYTDGEPAGVVAAALAPFAWRDLTDRMLARCAVGAADRHAVEVLLRHVSGTAVGDSSPIEPADPRDDRVDALVAALGGQQWRGWSLGRLSAQLLLWLDVWQRQRDSLESQLRRLLDER